MPKSNCSRDIAKEFGFDESMAESIVDRVRANDYRKHTKQWVKKTEQELDLAELGAIEHSRDLRVYKAEINKIIKASSKADVVENANNFFMNKYGGSRVTGELKLSVDVLKRTLRNETHNFLRQAMIGNGVEPEVAFKRLIDPDESRSILRAMEAINKKLDVDKSADPTQIAIARGLVDTFGRGLDNALESGVHINKKVDHLITQKLTHNQSKVRAAGPKQWIDDQMKELDFSRTFEELNGLRGNKLIRAREDALKSVHTEIRDATQKRGTGSITRSRKLNYKGADSFMNIHEKYGEGTLLELIHAQINGLAKAEALKVVIGNRAKELMEKVEKYTNEQIVKEIGPDEGARFMNQDFNAPKGMRDNLKNTVMGFDTTTADNKFSDMIDILKAVTLPKLGKAATNTLTDPMIQTGQFISSTGMPILEGVGKVYKELAKNVKDPARKKKIGMLLAMDMEASINRITGEDTNTKGFFGKYSSYMMKWTGLEWQTRLGHTTQAGLKSSWLADQSLKTFGELPIRTQSHFKSFGIKSDDWDVLRRAVDSESVDVALITPAKIREIGGSRTLQNKFAAMIMHDSNFGAISPDGRAKALLSFGVNPDSAQGKSLSAIFMFKSFMIRAGGALEEVIKSNPEANNATLFKALGNKGNLQIASTMMAQGMVLGVASLWARDLISNKTPRDMTDPKNFAEAMSKAVLPIHGEMAINFLSGKLGERGAKDLFLGPVAGGLADTMGALDAIRGDLADGGLGQKSGNATLKQIKSLTPGTYMPVVGALLDAILFDALGRLADPRYDQKKQKRLDKAGQDQLLEF